MNHICCGKKNVQGCKADSHPLKRQMNHLSLRFPCHDEEEVCYRDATKPRIWDLGFGCKVLQSVFLLSPLSPIVSFQRNLSVESKRSRSKARVQWMFLFESLSWSFGEICDIAVSYMLIAHFQNGSYDIHINCFVTDMMTAEMICWNADILCTWLI